MNVTEIPAYVYAYEITHSEMPTVPVGTVVIAKTNRLVKSWDCWNPSTTGFVSYAGKRDKRACPECYVIHNKVRDYGHAGEHGDGPHLIPTRFEGIAPADTPA